MQAIVPLEVRSRKPARFNPGPAAPAASTAPKLRDRMREQIRLEGKSPNTAAVYWHWTKGFIRFHGLQHPQDPGARVVTPTVRNARQTTISRAQMVALARACTHRGVRALIRIAYYSGMRVSEIQRAARVGAAFVLADTKNGHPRVVPMHPKIGTAAQVPMPKRSEIDYYWPQARAACNLEHVRLHDLRHSAASAMINAGEDLATVGAVLGHKSAASTKRYSHWAVARLAGAVGKIGGKKAA